MRNTTSNIQNLQHPLFRLVKRAILWYKHRVMTNLLATYVHHLDPILLDIPGTPIAVRWYGLAYLAGFVLGYLLLLRLSKSKLYCIEEEQLSDFIAMQVCLIGVVCGGRLGEFFFYWLPQHGLSGFLKDPTWVFRVWEGGMASHGGIIGVILVALFYARRHNLSFPRVLDGLAIVAPIGLCFGRIANFINGELYGRVCDAGSTLAMKFPLSVYELPYSTYFAARLSLESAMKRPYESFFLKDDQGMLLEGEEGMLCRMCRESETFRNTLAEYLEPRYPSQLFEAFGEGLLLFAVLIIVRLRFKNAPAGLFAGLFGVLYAIARVVCECLKEPDDAVWAGITKGQWLSFAIFAAGVAFLIHAFRQLKSQKLQKN